MREGGRGRGLLLDAWPLVLAVVLTFPLLTRSGHPLARDLVFVPHQPWTDASLGLGGAAPRAVPLDTVVSLLTAHVLDGGIVARVAIPLILAVAGWGMHRLVRSFGLVARFAAAGFAVWNPYVVERLALGQWALLAAYAALPWLVVAATSCRRTGSRRDLGAVAGWLALASLTPTGGLIGAATAAVCGVGRTVAGLRLLVVAAVLQLPWLLPSLLGSAALTSDPAGVRVFAADSEGPGGVLTALVGLGGIWDSRSVPASRQGWWSVAAAVVVVIVLVAGWRGLRRAWGPGPFARFVVVAALGFVLAVLPILPGGEATMSWVVGHLPGGGLARDSQKFLAPYVVLVVAAFAATVDRVASRAAGAGRELLVTVALVAVPLPIALLPDATALVWNTVDPVHYPSGFDTVAARVDGSGSTLVTLPWRSYRGFTWANGLVSSDPAVRWYDTDVLVPDDLAVGSTTVHGENVRSRDLGADLARLPVAEALRANEVSWALVYRDDPDAGSLDLTGLELVHEDADLALYAVPGSPATAHHASGATRAVVVGADLLAAGVAVGGMVLATRRRRNAPPQHDALLQ